jgi:hypothetical protein
MLGIILIKTLLKVLAVSAKSAAIRKASISGVIIASGVNEVARANKYSKPREVHENKEQDIKMIE